MSAAPASDRACGTRREAAGRDPRAAGRAPTAAGARRRVRGGGRGGHESWPRPRADGRARLFGQRGVVRRLRLRAPAGVDGDARLDLTLRLLRRDGRPHGSSVLGLSQSGQTPDVLEYIERARSRGAFTIGITNEPESSLATAAEVVLPLAAGPERAIAATKTYTNQIAALALLAGYAAGRGPEARGRHPAHRRPARRTAADARAARLRARRLAGLRRPHVRDRARHGVRHRTGDLAEAPRDVPGRGRAT